MALARKDRVQDTTQTTGTGPFALDGAVIADFRTFGSAHVAGATLEYFVSGAGSWEVGIGTLTDAAHLARTTVLSSSNGGSLVNFGTGSKSIFETVSAASVAGFLSAADGVDVSALTSLSATAAGDAVLLVRAGNVFLLPTTALGSSNTAPVDNPPTLSALSASATGSTTATGSVTTNETGGTLYWLFSTNATATAAAIKAGSSKAVTAVGAQTLPGTGLAAATPYYLHVLHRDTANQDSAVLSLGAPFTTQAAGAPAPTVTAVTVSPSTANVIGGGTVQLSATVAGANSPSQAVNWTIAGGGSVSASGLVTAPAPTGVAQTLTVTATSQQDGTTKGTATLTVAAQIITVNGPGPQTVGVTYTASGTYANGAPAALDFSVDGGTTWTAVPSPTIGGGNWSFPSTPSTASASRQMMVRDHTTLVSGISAAYVVNAAAPAPTPVAYQFNGKAFTEMPTTAAFSGGDASTPMNADFIIKTAAGVAPVDADVDVYAAMATSTTVMPRPNDAAHAPAPAGGPAFRHCGRLGAGNATYDGYYSYSSLYTYRSFGGGLANRYMWVIVFQKGADPATATPIFAAPYDGVHTGTPIAITVTA